MKNFYYQENECERIFAGLGESFHIYTPENFEIIFTSNDDFITGMNIIAVCTKLSDNIKLLTFEIMTNHIHLTVSSSKQDAQDYFELIKMFLSRSFKSRSRTIDWSKFVANPRRINSLDDLRNVIIYNNRNGFVANPLWTPFSYPWGANKYYFNNDAKQLSLIGAKPFSLRGLREITHSRLADSVSDLLSCNGCAVPLSFCDIENGEKLFRSPAQYFFMLGKNIEKQKNISKEIGESMFCNDDELYSSILSITLTKFSTSPADIPNVEKIELAKIMHNDYHASNKQISRILKLDIVVVDRLFPPLFKL